MPLVAIRPQLCTEITPLHFSTWSQGGKDNLRARTYIQHEFQIENQATCGNEEGDPRKPGGRGTSLRTTCLILGLSMFLKVKKYFSRMKLTQEFKLKLLKDCSVWVVPSFLIALFIIAICYESLLTHPLQIFELYYSGKIF